MTLLRIAVPRMATKIVVVLAFMALVLPCITASQPALAAGVTYYVDANNGNDNNSGTAIGSPFETIDRAAGVVDPGDVVCIRGGVYPGLSITTSGTSGSPITFEAYYDEQVIIDGSGANEPTVRVTASWNILRNIEVQNSGSQGIYVSDASDNVFEGIVTHDNYLSGLQIVDSSWRNTLRKVISHGNYGGEDTDGIGISSGGDNVLVGCVVYNNSDDGIDTWQSTNNLIERCSSHDNGYNGGEGNGIKFGPGGSNTVRNCFSFNNKFVGFTANEGGGSKVDNNTAFGNAGYQFDSWSTGANIFRNNIAYGGSDAIIAGGDTNNSWNLGISNPSFLSTDPTSPDFLSLASDSPAIARGIDVGLPYSGSAPDLGALEYGKKIGDLISALRLSPILMEGDVTGDGHVTMADAVAISQWRMGQGQITADQLLCADTNDDGVVDTGDAVQIIQWTLDPDGSKGILKKPLWESPVDDNMLKPVA